MIELLHATFSPVNLIPAILLVFVLAYWLLVVLGVLDMSAFDIDIDIDVDTDVEVDAEVCTEGEASVSWLNNILAFFNLDKMPLMVFMTFWALSIWIVSILVNHYTGNNSFILSLAFLIPTMIGSLFIAKIFTLPFVRVFQELDKDADSTAELFGRECKVILPATDQKMGQAELFIDGSNYRLNIKTKQDEVKKGENVLIINFIEAENCYIVERYTTI